MRIKIVADVKPLLGEGPVWDVVSERLYFVDSLGRRVFRCTEHGCEMRALPSRHSRKYPGDGPVRGSLFAIDGLGVKGREEPRFEG